MIHHQPWKCLHILTAFGLTCAAPIFSIATGTKKFESSVYGYTVGYPGDWHLQSLSGVFMIENFPASKAVRGVRLPPGGAEIVIDVPRRSKEPPQNLDDWVKKATVHQKVLSTREITLGGSARTILIVDVQTQCCGSPPFQQSTEWFFALEGHYFQASLIYWQGDPNAERLEQTLKEIVLSLGVRQ